MPDQDLNELRRRFLAAFRQALERETAAVRERSEPAVAAVDSLVEVVPGGADRPWVYKAALRTGSHRLLPDLECRLRTGAEEMPVSLLTVSHEAVTLHCGSPVAFCPGATALVVHPWSLLERLGQALAALAEADVSSLRLAFTVFGRLPPTSAAERLTLRHDGLNRSQGIALGNCLKSSCTFLWGPPGTGKTTTLARILLELLAHRHRILVTSHSNVAVDQVLRVLQRSPEAAQWLASGRTVRIGSPDPEWQDLAPSRLAERSDPGLPARRNRLRQLRQRFSARREICKRLLARLGRDQGPRQPGLFGAMESTGPWQDAGSGPPQPLAGWPGRFSPEERTAALRRRLARVDRALAAVDRALLEQHQATTALEQRLVREARLVLATAAAVTVNRLVQGQTFDTVIIEEAAMVPLPMVFLCAARATAKVVVVGDPMQLPCIVQSTDPFVARAMARSIFAVAAPRPFLSPLVTLLDEQYRMHPAIGELISQSFYGGRLRHPVPASDFAHLVHAPPYRGQALVLLDTAGRTSCEPVEPGPSRTNPGNAEVVAGLVREALAGGVQSIAVITPYAAQARLVRTLLAPAGAPPERVVCRTVHGFQGNERDIVIFDTVDTEPFAPGVLVAGDRPWRPAANLINVAVSRARGKLIVLADRTYYRNRCPRAAVARVVEACAAMGLVVTLPATGAGASRPGPAAPGSAGTPQASR